MRFSRYPATVAMRELDALEGGWVHHFLFECAAWQCERWHMSNKLGRAAKEANSVMNTPKGVTELMKYVGHTGRFKDVFGELS